MSLSLLLTAGTLAAAPATPRKPEPATSLTPAQKADYAQVIRTVEAQLTGQPVYLIETLAQQIAARILGTFGVVKAVTVEVTKPFAPVAAEFDAISVKIRRERA
ncbi:dihydroneopterin aldolase [bacterium]|nr:dihydroneopterin aldolase [bacterium]